MRTREEILLDLINFDRGISSLSDELSAFPWDCDEALVVLGSENLIKVFNKLTDGVISLTDIADWADVIEFRDDIDLESEAVKEIIFELATPLLFSDLTTEKIIFFRTRLLNS